MPTTTERAWQRLRDRIDWDAPFARLATTHGLGAMGEAMLAMALASSLFFKTDPAEGREKVLLGLLITMAPFAVVGPLIGPVMDRVRGGHRAVVVGSMALRAATATTMVWAVADESWVLFPAAFVMLVLSKTYQVARAAVVPTVVPGDRELIEANSKLQLLGGVAGVLGSIPGGLLFLVGPAAVTVGCALCFGAASLASLQIPPHRVAETPPAPAEVAELRGAAVVLAASAMAVLRAMVGFVTFLLAFELRGAQRSPVENLAEHLVVALRSFPGLVIEPLSEPPKWYFAVIVVVGLAGSMAGASLAPRLRSMLSEERILLGAAAFGALGALVGSLISGLASYVVLGGSVAVAGSTAKQAFDSLVQRDAPDANRGRSFARFESRFQVAWVIGAVVPTALHLPFDAGAGVVAAAGIFAAGCYWVGRFPQLSRSGKSGISRSRGSSGSV